MYDKYLESAEYIKSKINAEPDVAIILGSGLGSFAEQFDNPVIIPYNEIPNFPVSTVSYHKGEFVYGEIGGKKVLAMNGRFHFYEGYEMWQTAYPIGVFKILNVKKLIITNAAGGISEDYRPGDFVCVRDHIKLVPDSPMRGKHIPEFGGQRFFDMQHVYDKEMIALAHRIDPDLKDGVYAYMAGPQFETPAEIRMLKIMGATLVGMSTIAEVIAAANYGLPVLCISCVSNMAAGITGAVLTHEEVVETGLLIAEKFKKLIGAIINEIVI